jgi:hypothetical protein
VGLLYGAGAGGARGRAAQAAPDEEMSPCNRCGVSLRFEADVHDQQEMHWPLTGGPDAEIMFCPVCADATRSGGEREGLCAALKKADGEPCSQRLKGAAGDTGRLFCLFHNAPSKRGSNPAIGQRYLDEMREKSRLATAALEKAEIPILAEVRKAKAKVPITLDCSVCGLGRHVKAMLRLASGELVCHFCASDKPGRTADPDRRASALAELARYLPWTQASSALAFKELNT